MLASQASRPDRGEFGKRIETSNLPLSLFATENTPSFGSIGITASTSGIDSQNSTRFRFANIVTAASGLPRLIYRTASHYFTASPSHIVDRITIRNGFS